ncbi:non-canonical purine NTP pyrophosphatase [Euryarchaeota archaeon]|jgi:XTP/dITP diphosphohydrolase|nr:non-canonical purine NTP pyrophosphatase [Euryarchaeota archaeon]
MKVLFLTSNENKVTEANQTLSELGYEIEQFRINGLAPKIIEPQSSEIEIVSEFKIQQALELISGTNFENHALLVEDSGLFIESLDDFPGVYSSYFFRTVGNQGILKLLENESNRNAEYRAYSILYRDGVYFRALGKCLGRISTEIKGSNGFGYDPIFIPDSGDGRTFGEMQDYEKESKSHRGESLRILYDKLSLPSK